MLYSLHMDYNTGWPAYYNLMKNVHLTTATIILICYTHIQILWSKEFAEAIFCNQNLEGKTPLQLAIEKGHVK